VLTIYIVELGSLTKIKNVQRHLMAVSPAHIDYAFMGTMMSFGSLGYKVERVKKVRVDFLEFLIELPM
jgi:hypothetical protein